MRCLWRQRTYAALTCCTKFISRHRNGPAQGRPQPVEHRTGIFGGRQPRRAGGNGHRRAKAGAETAHHHRPVLRQQGAYGGIDVFALETPCTGATAPPPLARAVAQAYPPRCPVHCDSSRICQARFSVTNSPTRPPWKRASPFCRSSPMTLSRRACAPAGLRNSKASLTLRI